MVAGEGILRASAHIGFRRSCESRRSKVPVRSGGGSPGHPLVSGQNRRGEKGARSNAGFRPVMSCVITSAVAGASMMPSR